jgi:glycosyltransferase involved in cell wall biosynthesis
VLLAGDGPERERLADHARRAGLDGVVQFLGFRRDVSALLAVSDCVALPSLSEGLPNIVLEAFAAGRPVVASAVGGVPELVLPGETGWLVPPRDPAALADALAECLSDRARGESTGAQGRPLVRSHYSRERQVERLTRVFAAAAAGRAIREVAL